MAPVGGKTVSQTFPKASHSIATNLGRPAYLAVWQSGSLAVWRPSAQWHFLHTHFLAACRDSQQTGLGKGPSHHWPIRR